jgi:RHS repeat-associated protein
MGPGLDFLLGRVDPSGNPTWYLTDNLGSVRMLVDSSGNNKDQLTYDSYGNILTETNSANGDRFKFTGRESDSEIGQYFYRARYYGPSIGRFESEDPLDFASGDTNLFRYVSNAPNQFSDPSGMQSPVPPTYPVPYIGIGGQVKIGNEILNNANILVNIKVAKYMANSEEYARMNNKHTPGPQGPNEVGEWFAGFVDMKTGWWTWKKVPIIAKKTGGIVYVLVPYKNQKGQIVRIWIPAE